MGTNAATAAAYYDGAATAAFYRLCWGGADIHIGLYETGAESVADASHAMTRHLLALADLGPGERVLDIACGYGGTLRELARQGCTPHGIDISQVCVEEARRLNRKAGLESIAVAVGDFHHIESAPDIFDTCVCQEAIIHSTDRPRVFAEVFRVLRPGGTFALSDILTAEGANLAMVDAAFARLGVRGGATLADYQQMARQAGFTIRHTEERPRDIAIHYDKLAATLETPPDCLAADDVYRLQSSITAWRAALAGGHITWGALIATKPG